MADGALHRLSLTEAIAQHALLPLSLRPATLHPLYVEADARRNSALRPVFLTWREQSETWSHAVHLTDIEGTEWRDASSPYGYGGPLSTSDDPAFLQRAWQAYGEWMQAHQVVVEYVRFHPVLANERHYCGQILDNRQVVSINLAASGPGTGYAARLQQVVKRAHRLGVQYRELPLAGWAAAFGAYYRSAMQAIGADPFYFFDDAYFQALTDSGLARLGLCTHPDHGEDWLAACLLLDGNGVREYHLAATKPEGRRFGASSLALHGAAQVARELGQRQFYLGGGTDRREDNALLFFKGGFSGVRLPYRTGWSVFHPAGYEALRQWFGDSWTAYPERPIFWRKV